MEVIDIWLSVVEISQPLCPNHIFFSVYWRESKTQAGGISQVSQVRNVADGPNEKIEGKPNINNRVDEES